MPPVDEALLVAWQQVEIEFKDALLKAIGSQMPKPNQVIEYTLNVTGTVQLFAGERVVNDIPHAWVVKR